MLMELSANTLADIVLIGGAIVGIDTTIDKFVKNNEEKIAD